MKIRVLALLVVALVAVAAAVEAPASFGAESQAQLLRKLWAAQGSDGLLPGGVEATRDAMDATVAMGGKVPNAEAVCTAAAAAGTSFAPGTDNMQKMAASLGLVHGMRCAQRPTMDGAKWMKAVTAVMQDTGRLDAFVAALEVYARSTKLKLATGEGLGKAYEKLMGFQRTTGFFGAYPVDSDPERDVDGTFEATSLALRALAVLRMADNKAVAATAVKEDIVDGCLSEVLAAASDLLADAADGTVSLGSLEATAGILRGAVAAARAAGMKTSAFPLTAPLSRAIAAFVLGQSATAADSPATAAAFARALASLADGPSPRPLLVEVTPQVVAVGASAVLRIALVDVLGKPAVGVAAPTVTAAAGSANPSAVAVVTSGDVFTADITAAAMERGVVHIAVRSDGGGAFGACDAAFTIRVQGEASFSTVEVSVDGARHTASYPNSLSTTLALSGDVRLKAMLADGTSALQQVQLVLRPRDGGNSVVLALRPSAGGYGAAIRAAQWATVITGTYDAVLVGGDVSLGAALEWPLGTVTVEGRPAPTRRPDIVHKFREAPRRPPFMVSYVAAVVTAAPLLFLVAGILAVGGNFRALFATFVPSVLFLGGVAAVAAMLVAFWTCVDFITLSPYLVAALVYTFATGVMAMRARYRVRVADEAAVRKTA